MANWTNPLLTSTYVNFLAELKARDSDLAKMFDVGAPTNVETDTVRWNSAADRFELWNASAWVELTAKYLIDVDTLDGNHSSAFAAASHVGAGGSAHVEATTSVSGFMKAADKQTMVDATADPAASKLMIRDGAGRAAVAAPSAADDIARKDTVDTHANLTNPHSATAAATANRLILRDGAGRAKVVSPSVSTDIANKAYADSAGMDAASIAEQEAGTSTTKATTPGRQHRHPSAAKAWVKFNPAGAIQAPDYNVVSVAKNAAGDWTVTISTDFSTANYVAVATAFNTNANDRVAQIDAQAVGTLGVTCTTGAGAKADPTSFMLVAMYGDQ